MKNTRVLLALVGAAAVGVTVPAAPYAHTNFGFAHDSYLWQPQIAKTKKEIRDVTRDGTEKVRFEQKDKFKVNYGVSVEYGFEMEGLDGNQEIVEPLRIFGPNESAINMFMGEVDGTPAANFITGLTTPLNLTDDDVRGRVTLSGKRKESDINIWLSTKLPFESIPGRWEASFYLPFKLIETADIEWTNLPNPNNLPMGEIQTKLTNVLESATETYCDGLLVNQFVKHGLGDMTFMLSWCDEYEQLEDGLSKVALFARVGVSIPTSEKRDEDNALSVPLGNDGAWGIPVVLGMNLFFENKVRLGVTADTLLLFDESSDRRLKTHAQQTELLLSQKVLATRKPGTQLRITALGEAMEIADMFTIGVGYQGSWRSEDEFSVDNAIYNDTLTGPVNTAERYQESVYHQFIAHTGFDWSEVLGAKHGPKLELFYKHPIKKGKRVSIYKTFGAQLSFNF